MRNLFLTLALLATTANMVQADDFLPDFSDVGNYEDFLPLPATDTGVRPATRTVKRHSPLTIIPFITSSIPEAAAYNISQAEQVFCYHVAKRPKGYTGYTLGNYAVVDYCGELTPNDITTAYEALFTKSPNIITVASDCKIEPKVMLRFVRGVDSTDVLLSSPCPSFTIFYGGRYKSFNIKQGIIDGVINQYSQKQETFNSPTLIRKTVANAEADTTKEAELLEKKNRENAPVMNWKKQETAPAAQNSSTTQTDKPSKGWSNLKFKL